jgi:3-phenylpropionate/cinnamic acid dioxygenase small subunit
VSANAATARERYEQCAAFLFEEAEYLDDRRFTDWINCLAPDLVYEVPVRVTRGLEARDGEFSRDAYHMRDSFASMQMRVNRLQTEHAFGEDPPSRTTRLINNVRVSPRDGGEADVKSNFLLYRAEGDSSNYELLAGERRDVLRQTDDGWKLARRHVRLAHTTLPASLGVFL